MAARRREYRKRPTDRQPQSVAASRSDEAGVAGLVCLGYPFDPSGRPERLRTAHLEGLASPCLIVQGARDALGGRGPVVTTRRRAGSRV